MSDLFEFEQDYYANENFIDSETSSVSSSSNSEVSSGSLPICVAPSLGPPLNSLRISDLRPLHSSPVQNQPRIIVQSVPREDHRPRRFSFPLENYENLNPNRRNAISIDQSGQLSLIGEQLTLMNRRDNRREAVLTAALILMILLIYIITITTMSNLAKISENNN